MWTGRRLAAALVCVLAGPFAAASDAVPDAAVAVGPAAGIAAARPAVEANRGGVGPAAETLTAGASPGVAGRPDKRGSSTVDRAGESLAPETVFPAASAAEPASAECTDLRFDGAGYTVCTVHAAVADLRVFLSDADGLAWGQFHRLDAALRAQGRALLFAMNAGMYHPDLSPVGLYVEDGAALAPVVARPGPGNFGMLPNGVLCIGDGRADVIETRRFLRDRPACRHATQSGPMLVIDGALHPRFIPDSPSRFVRNGVGTTEDGRQAVFAISDRPVNFHSFARLFRDALGLNQALYLDGNVSRLWAPGAGRRDAGWRIGPIVAVVGPAP